ncbi:MAG: CHAD domain-containing protein [Bacteroidota bacterium]|nr:CHAD domain-containing protein [Bacteroidota bacterium]
MKTSKPGTGYLKKLRKNIITLLKKSAEQFEDEDYHKLRVEIKKLKAVAGFIEFSHKKFSKKKALTPFKKIYKQAGKVRELQLEASFLKKNNPQFIEQYLSDLDKRIEKEKKKFASPPRNQIKSKTKKTIKEIELFFQDTNEADSIEFINNERKQIAQLTRELPLKPANVHQLRKILKEDFYNRKRMDQPSPKIKAEDDFLELLGSWHDCVVLNNQIGTSILKAEIDPAELAELLKINADVSLQSENLFNEINATLEKGVF